MTAWLARRPFSPLPSMFATSMGCLSRNSNQSLSLAGSPAFVPTSTSCAKPASRWRWLAPHGLIQLTSHTQPERWVPRQARAACSHASSRGASLSPAPGPVVSAAGLAHTTQSAGSGPGRRTTTVPCAVPPCQASVAAQHSSCSTPLARAAAAPAPAAGPGKRSTVRASAARRGSAKAKQPSQEHPTPPGPEPATHVSEPTPPPTPSPSTPSPTSRRAKAPAPVNPPPPPLPPPPTRYIVVAVDPDLNGAIAVIFWDDTNAAPSPPCSDPPSSSSSSASIAPPLSYWPGGPGLGHPPSGPASLASLWAGGEMPAPPSPGDLSRCTVRVWDMPVSAAERKTRTASGRVSRRRLVHIAGAREVLAAALAEALPLPPEPSAATAAAGAPPPLPPPVAMFAYVEVPPILPGDGSLAAYACLYSTGAWLGLLTAMGFAAGSTPVRQWKTDLGLFGAGGKDASLALAKTLFPDQEPILRRKADHGRADALLIAAWALGATLPRALAATLRRSRDVYPDLAAFLAAHPGVGLAWGAPRPPLPYDAYGGMLAPEADADEHVEAAHAKHERKEAAREARRKQAEEKKAISSTRTKKAKDSSEGSSSGSLSTKRRKKVADPGAELETDAPGGAYADAAMAEAEQQEGSAAPVSGRRVRRARGRSVAVAAELTADVDGAIVADGEAPVAAAPKRKTRTPKKAKSSQGEVGVAPALE